MVHNRPVRIRDLGLEALWRPYSQDHQGSDPVGAQSQRASQAPQRRGAGSLRNRVAISWGAGAGSLRNRVAISWGAGAERATDERSREEAM
jgi:hypothetical protein